MKLGWDRALAHHATTNIKKRGIKTTVNLLMDRVSEEEKQLENTLLLLNLFLVWIVG